MTLALPFLGTALLLGRKTAPVFDHAKHGRLFPLCTTCHAGVLDPARPLWPTAESCGACHDGRIRPLVEWSPPLGPRPSNLRFTHTDHHERVLRRSPADSLLRETCSSCHTEAGTTRMEVTLAAVARCLDCHQLGPLHLAAPDTACASCHVPLAQARVLSPERIQSFPYPPSHQSAGWELEGHGIRARVPGPRPGQFTVAPSCATCHARDFCITCHVNAPEVDVIQALAPDPRSVVLALDLPVPASHRVADFERAHGAAARRTAQSCATCHTQESCLACHAGSPPTSVRRLARAGPGRGTGAVLARTPPATHAGEFRDRHGAQASARGTTCQSCHTRNDCLSCHRPEPKSGGDTYHPTGFLSRHPTVAWSREATCSDCHNVAQFCQSCHRQAGITAGRPQAIGTVKYHDAKAGWGLGHGQAARQNLESCVSCHAERDCTPCHSAVNGGFRFNPHGPGFNAERLRRRNPLLCVACHGEAIPR
jgi:hypothetical protein